MYTLRKPTSRCMIIDEKNNVLQAKSHSAVITEKQESFQRNLSFIAFIIILNFDSVHSWLPLFLLIKFLSSS